MHISIAPERRGLFVVVTIALLLIAFVVALHGPLLARYGRWLVREDPETASDAVVVLGGHSGFRVRAGARLVERGLATRLAMTAQPAEFPDLEEPSVNRWRALAESLGVDRGAIDVLMPSYSTFDDAWLARRYAEDHGFRSLLFVTDPYHTRRARWVLSRVFDGSGIEIGMRACEQPWFRADAWWKDERQFLTVTQEYAKLAYYALAYGVRGRMGDEPSAVHAAPARSPGREAHDGERP